MKLYRALFLPDLAAKMASYEAAGVKILSAVRDVQGKFKYAFVEDPWVTRLTSHPTLSDKTILASTAMAPSA